MKLIIPLFAIFLLAGIAAAQLSSDRERFDVELHPGEVLQKYLILTNTGDSPIAEISKTSIGGNAKDLIYLEMPEEKTLDPKDDEKIKIFFAVPPETEPGTYTGFMYLMDSPPPSVPLAIEFHIKVTEQESYGLSLLLDDANKATDFAKSDQPAEFDIEIRNTGKFRDIASINTSELPRGWSVSLMDGDNEIDLPYNLPLPSGTGHIMKLKINSENPRQRGVVNITATSMGNTTKISTAQANVKFGIAVRAYKASIDVPERIVVNRSYNGAFGIELGIEEKIKVGVFTPPNMMVIPQTQLISVSPQKAGTANFTILATQPGRYLILFKGVDSNGVPLPDETTTINVVKPSGTAILTADSFIYKTIASLARKDNHSVPVILVPLAGLIEKDKENLQSYSDVIILGNKSIVSSDIEKSLENMQNIKRVEGENVAETSWRFVSEMWTNGTLGIVICGPKDLDIFKAYQEAGLKDYPLVICDSPMNNKTRSIILDLTKRNVRLSEAKIVGKVPDDTQKTLRDLGISIKQVT